MRGFLVSVLLQIVRLVPGAEIPEQNDAPRQEFGIVGCVHSGDDVGRRLAIDP